MIQSMAMLSALFWLTEPAPPPAQRNMMTCAPRVLVGKIDGVKLPVCPSSFPVQIPVVSDFPRMNVVCGGSNISSGFSTRFYRHLES